MRTALLALLAGFALAGTAEARDYTILRQGIAIGSMSVTGSAASPKVAYGYSSNGRGPKLTFDFTVDAKGLPTGLTVGGLDTLQVPASETLAVAAGRLAWTSSVDKGDGDRGAFYLPFHDFPELHAMLARALRKAPPAGLNLLPSGHATMTEAASENVTAGGKTRKVRLFFLHGIEFAPIPVWLGPDDAFFAEIGSSATIEDGWAEVLPQLRAVQTRLVGARDTELAKTLGKRPDAPVVIRHANLYDADAKAMRPGTSVVLDGNRIAAVGPDDSVVAPEGASVIDAAGKALLPGLWDMHFHFGSNTDGLLLLATGTTTVREMGNDLTAAVDWRRRFSTGELAGPRMLLAGLIDGRSPTATVGVQVSTPQEVSRAVNMFADNGYSEIKIYSSFPLPLLPAAIEQGHRRGLRVGGHVPVGLRLDDVVRMGFDDVSHLNFVMLNFLSDEVQKRTNTLARVLEPAANTRLTDANGPAVTATIEAMKTRGVVLDSTAVVFENLFEARPGTLRAAYVPYGDRLPPKVLRGGRGGGLAKNDEERAIYTQSFENALRMLKRMHDAGIPIVPGTDGIPGILLPHELALYVQAGIPAVDALQMATLVPARMMKLDADLGSVAAGKIADLFLVDGDPSKDIGAVRNVALVVKDGVFYDGDALAGAVGMGPRKR